MNSKRNKIGMVVLVAVLAGGVMLPYQGLPGLGQPDSDPIPDPGLDLSQSVTFGDIPFDVPNGTDPGGSYDPRYRMK